MNDPKKRVMGEFLNTSVVVRLMAGWLAVLAIGSAATAAPFTVSSSPPAPAESLIQFDYQDDFFGSIGSTGPLPASGAADATVSVSADAPAPWSAGSGDGSFDFHSAAIVLGDNEITLSFGFLGTIDLEMSGVTMSIESTGGIPVVDNEWNLDVIGAPTTMAISFNDGTMTLDNATGPLADQSGAEDLPIVFDFAASPYSLSLADLVGSGIGGTADSQSIGLQIPEPGLFAENVTDEFVTLDPFIHGDLYLALVPEPTSAALMIFGVVAFIGLGYRRFRRT